jgi:hypothetical protein
MSPQNNLKPQEIERWFDVNTPITLEFFKSYYEFLTQYSKDPNKVRCEFWMNASNEDRRVIIFNNDKILDFIKNHWNEVSETVIFLYTGPIKYSVLNLQHHYMRIRIQSSPEITSTKVFSSLNKHFSLSHSEPHPYKYRRSSIEFDVGRWKPKDFALGIKNISNLIGPNPYIVKAYVKSFVGDIEKLTPFFDLNSFLDYTDRRASTFGAAFIQLRARSTDIGIGVPSDHKKLRIRTSIPPENVDDILDAWPEDLRLSQVKAVDTGDFFGEGEPNIAKDNSWVKYGIPIMVAFITAFSVAGIVSLKKAIWPNYKIVVTNPISENGKAISSNQQLVVDWYLQPEKQSLRNVRKDSIGTVRLMDNSGKLQKIVSKAPVSLNTPPGDYTLSVDVDETAPVIIKLKVVKNEHAVSGSKKKKPNK